MGVSPFSGGGAGTSVGALPAAAVPMQSAMESAQSEGLAHVSLEAAQAMALTGQLSVDQTLLLDPTLQVGLRSL